MLERLTQRRYLLLALVLFIFIAYVVYREYDTSQRCGGKPCPEELTAKLIKKYSNSPNCSNGLCPFDLVREWEDNKCPIELSNSLVYDVHIANNPDGSLKDFTCEFGPMYKLVDSTPTEATIKDCSQETVESLDNAIKGKNMTPVKYVRTIYVFPPNFVDYHYTVLACDKDTSGRFNGRYLMLTFVNFSGLLYG